MVSMDIFNADPFSTIQLSGAVQRNPYQPTGLGDLGIFDDFPIRTKILGVEQRQGKLVLIPFSERGQEGTQRITEKREMRFFQMPRLMHDDTITADEIQGIRAFGTESEQMQVEAEVARRLAGPTGLQSSLEYTWEYHRLAAIGGKLLDSDGSVFYDYFAEFGYSAPSEVAFNLAANAANTIRGIVNPIVRTMARKAQGAFLPSTRVYALCGDTFYDAFTQHTDVVRTFLNWQAAADLRGEQGAAFGAFDFAGVTWLNYRGSDDTTTIAVDTNKALFFPKGAPGVFQRALAPGEAFDWVNTPGKDQYVIPIPDRDRNMWWKMELYSYPLHICTRPEILQIGHAGA